MQLKSLPSTETFVSHTSNALSENTITVSNNSLSISLPPLSITAILLKGVKTGKKNLKDNTHLKVYPYPSKHEIYLEQSGNVLENSKVNIYNLTGKLIKTLNWDNDNSSINVNTEDFEEGIYFVELKNKTYTQKQKIIITK